MSEGCLEIRWENAAAEKDGRVYRVLFLPFQGQHGALRYQKTILGEGSLREYLLSLLDKSMTAERRNEVTDQRLRDLHGFLSLNPVRMTDEQLAELETQR